MSIEKITADLPDDWCFVPVKGKVPAIEGWQTGGITFDELTELRSESSEWQDFGYGLLCGPLSGNTVCIDFDGIEAQQFLERQGIKMTQVLKTRCWTSGKPGRFQAAYRVPDDYIGLIHTLKTGPDNKLEFRWKGAQSVIPPSPHPETGSYRWLNNEPVREIPISILQIWIDELFSKKPREIIDAFDPVDVPMLSSLLRAIRGVCPRPSYDMWRQMTWAAVAECGADGLGAMKTVFPPERRNEYDLLMRGYNAAKSPRFGTLVFFLKKYKGSWTPSRPVINEKKLRPEHLDMSVEYVEGQCGSGKTHWMLNHILQNKGRYIVAVPTIKNINEFHRWFNDIGGWMTYKSNVFKIHSNSESDVESVANQLKDVRHTLYANSSTRPALVFITHAALMMNSWDRWSDFTLIIDEVPEVFKTWVINAKKHSHEVEKYFYRYNSEEELTEINLTTTGKQAVIKRDFDDLDKVLRGLMETCLSESSKVWVFKKDWDEMMNQVMRFISLFDPTTIMPFKRRIIMGDEVSKSLLFLVWSYKWNISWNRCEDWAGGRERRVPIRDRVAVAYFSQTRRASKRAFEHASQPLVQIEKWLTTQNVRPLWTKNRYHFLETVNLGGEGYAPPKAHGRNDLTHYQVVAWMAAMKVNGMELRILDEVLGLKPEEITRWREHNAMYQFLMRSNLRDYESGEFVMVFVFDYEQALYLSERWGLDEDNLHYVEGVVSIDALTTAQRGRPRKYKTDEEKKKARKHDQARKYTKMKAIKAINSRADGE